MPRPAVTKGDVQRVVAGAIAGGLEPGAFAIYVEGGRVTLFPCQPADPVSEPLAKKTNPFDSLMD